jgi:hypothetical protein
MKDKLVFLQELAERRALCPGPRCVIDDFNMILRSASEKNNVNLHMGIMSSFIDFVGA